MSSEQNEEIGSLTGIVGGALAGASVGSAVLPVFGTFAGALVGGIVGSQIGRTVGGTVLNAFDPKSASPQTSTPADNPDIISQLERLGNLHSQGVITEDEFKAAKAKLLNL
jgi:phage tail tape-measure protein